MDDVAQLLAGLLARCEAGRPTPGDGFTLSCVPGRGAGPDPRWELLVTRAGAVVDETAAADPAAALRSLPGAETVEPAADAAAAAVSAPAAGGHPGGSDPGVLLRALERIAVAVPLVLDVDAVWDRAPGAGDPAWAWTVSATRWDVVVEGSALRWGAGSAREALALALADLDDGPLSR